MASLQGYLLRNKTRPRECVDEVHEWIAKERETRAKLKKEKEEVGVFIPLREYSFMVCIERSSRKTRGMYARGS